jgi:hypothetical protein
MIQIVSESKHCNVKFISICMQKSFTDFLPLIRAFRDVKMGHPVHFGPTWVDFGLHRVELKISVEKGPKKVWPEPSPIRVFGLARILLWVSRVPYFYSSATYDFLARPIFIHRLLTSFSRVLVLLIRYLQVSRVPYFYSFIA